MSEHAAGPGSIQQADDDAFDSVVVNELLEQCLDRWARWQCRPRRGRRCQQTTAVATLTTTVSIHVTTIVTIQARR